ncbi:MAG: phosphate acyltransferase PlsX [Clostridia bacterium]|nr:phosphate acyltransferase PlsX [Clostridia bacterium]
MKIAVDAMGGDRGPEVTVKGCIDAVNEYKDAEIVLVGSQKAIEGYMEKFGYTGSRIQIYNATQQILNEDEPVRGIKTKKDSSMVKGLEMLKRGEVNAFISAGNTGALLAGSFLKVGRIKGIKRPALSPVIPTLSKGSLLIDSGANTDCTPVQLYQFALMGAVYMNKVMGVDRPSIGLVNIGTESHKGNELAKDAFKILKESDLNFYGNIEARDIPAGKVDVLVCDGFVGNVVLKLIEGTAGALFSLLKEEFTRNIFSKAAAGILKPGLKNIKNKLDYTEYGGAPLLGIDGLVVKAHGSSNENAIKNAIKQSVLFDKNKVISIIKEHLTEGINDG